jgi:beta-N-acetylhexosaminidase
MKAVAQHWKAGAAAVLAAKAGCDLIPVCIHTDAQVDAIEGLVRAVEAGEIGWTAMDAAIRRIQRLKDRFLLPYRDPDPRLARQAAGAGERVALAAEIADRGGTTV